MLLDLDYTELPAPATQAELEERVCKYIQDYHNVTCVELAKHFGSGDCIIYQGHNVVVCFGLSDDLCDVLIKMISEHTLMLVPGSFLTYAMDGSVMDLPIAKRVPANGYKDPHWLISNLMPWDRGVNYIQQVYADNPAELKRMMKLLEKQKAGVDQ